MDTQEVLRTELAAIFLDAVEDPAVFALFTVMTAEHPAEADEEILARYVLGRLAAQGWQITRRDGRVVEPPVTSRAEAVRVYWAARGLSAPGEEGSA